jgi:hypothetical protein
VAADLTLISSEEDEDQLSDEEEETEGTAEVGGEEGTKTSKQQPSKPSPVIAPRHRMNRKKSKLPPGLRNNGNLCFLNSTLQVGLHFRTK